MTEVDLKENFSPSAEERFHFLDGIRAIAACLIVFHHYFTSNVVKAINYFQIPYLGDLLINFTQSGVELFFVMSGVVLLRPYLRGKRKLKIGNYLIRRIKRIWPPYLAALVFASFVIWINTFYPTWYSLILMPFTWEKTFSQIFIFNLNPQYYNLAWWSLQIEIVFYLLVPIVLFIFTFLPKPGFKLFLLFIFLIAGIVVTQIYFDAHFSYYYSIKYITLNVVKIIDYPVCFLLGTYIAAYDFQKNHAYLFMTAGVGLLLVSFAYHPIVHSAYGFIYAAIIILTFNITSLKNILSKPFLIWLGERSYSLFLTHFSVFYLVNYLTSFITEDRNITYGIITRTVGLPAAIFIAMLLFHFVERKQTKGLLTADQFWPFKVNLGPKASIQKHEQTA